MKSEIFVSQVPENSQSIDRNEKNRVHVTSLKIPKKIHSEENSPQLKKIGEKPLNQEWSFLEDQDERLYTMNELEVTSYTYNIGNFFGLPKIVREQYEKIGIFQLYEWQLSVLSSSEFLSGRNIVYSIPTSGGKVSF